MTRAPARRKGRARSVRRRVNGYPEGLAEGPGEQRARELLQTIHGFGSLGFLLALSEARARRAR